MSSQRRGWTASLLCLSVIALAIAPAADSSAARRVTKRTAYFADLDAGKIFGVEIKFGAKPKLKLRKTYNGVANPWGIAIDPDGKFLLVTDYVAGTVSKLSLPKGKVTSTVAVGSAPTDVGIMPSGDFAFILNSGSDTVSVYDTRTDQVLDTLAVGDHPLRLKVNERGTSLYIANTDNDVITKLNARSAVGLETDPSEPTVQSINRTGICDVSGGIESVRVPGASPFNYIMWTCGSGVTAGSASVADRVSVLDSRSHDGEEDDSDDCRSTSSSSDDCSSSDRDGGPRRSAPIHPAARAPFPFTLPGGPVDLEAVGIARAPSFLNGGFCTTNSIVVSYRAAAGADDSLAGSVSYLWRFGENARELADGYAFGPLFGGAANEVYATPICGPGCTANGITSKTKSLTIPAASNIIDGAMLPVPFGPDC